MSQHDLDIAAGRGIDVRADINSAIKALASNFSGPVAPTNPQPSMWWSDTAANRLKRRNAANSAWIDCGPIDRTPFFPTDMIAGAGGTADAITASFTPAVTALVHGLYVCVRATGANTSTAPTFTPASGSIAAKAIVKGAGNSLSQGDIFGAGHWIELMYDSTADKWVLLNPASGIAPIFGMKNAIINGAFNINQRAYSSGSATNAGQYTLDRWKVTGTQGITFSSVNNSTTVTIPAGQTLQQVIEGLNLSTGNYVLSWTGSAQGRVGAGAYGASGQVVSVTGGANLTIEFGPGTVSNVQFEPGIVVTPFERRLIQQEDILCKRYFCKFSASASGAYPSAVGAIARGAYYFPVAMRTVPTIVTGIVAASSNVGSYDLAGSITPLNTGGILSLMQGASAGNFSLTLHDNMASAEL